MTSQPDALVGLISAVQARALREAAGELRSATTELRAGWAADAAATWLDARATELDLHGGEDPDWGKVRRAASAIEGFTEMRGLRHMDREGLALDLALHLSRLGLLSTNASTIIRRALEAWTNKEEA